MQQQPITLDVIESAVVLEQCADDHTEPVQIDATLSYDPADPFAVTLVMLYGGLESRWTFARELLVEGMFEEAGIGDVAIFPSLNVDANAFTVIELRGPDAAFLGQLATREVTAFVQATTRVVPVGAESDLVDVDGLLARLLAEA